MQIQGYVIDTVLRIQDSGSPFGAPSIAPQGLRLPSDHPGNAVLLKPRKMLSNMSSPTNVMSSHRQNWTWSTMIDRATRTWYRQSIVLLGDTPQVDCPAARPTEPRSADMEHERARDGTINKDLIR
jgi:hypothetical protein